MLSSLALLLSAAAVASAQDRFTLHTLKDTHPAAKCNDGTPAGYYLAPSTSNSSLWIVFLEGGGCACWGAIPLRPPRFAMNCKLTVFPTPSPCRALQGATTPTRAATARRR